MTDMTQVRTLVDRAVRAATPPDQQVERRLRPESEHTWMEPSPAAGLNAALTVVKIAQQMAYKFVLGLRGEGTSWREAADLLDIPWSDQYARDERAYDLVLNPDPDSRYNARFVYWVCGGPSGCGKSITDHGPYNGSPVNNEDGHADGCRRLAAEDEAYERELVQREERARIMDKALPWITDPFGQETVKRARYVQTHGGTYLGWSTSESIAVALILRDTDQLAAHGYSTPQDALQRILRGMGQQPQDPTVWLWSLRAAATGMTDASDSWMCVPPVDAAVLLGDPYA